MSKKRSYAWDRFMHEFFERSAYMQWHDGVNPDVVLDLVGDERDEAEELLIESVKEGGMWPTKGLAVMKSKKALPVFKQKIQTAYGAERIRIAEAIEDIEGSGKYVPVLIDELRNNVSEYIRLEAAMVLKKFPSQTVIDALYEGVMDPSYLVRNHSSESLLAIHGYEPEISQYHEIFKLICADKPIEGKKPPELHAKAVEMLKELLKDAARLKELTQRLELLNAKMKIKGLKLADYEALKEEIEEVQKELAKLK